MRPPPTDVLSSRRRRSAERSVESSLSTGKGGSKTAEAHNDELAGIRSISCEVNSLEAVQKAKIKGNGFN